MTFQTTLPPLGVKGSSTAGTTGSQMSLPLVDLTHKLNPNVQVYPGDPTFSCTPFASIETDGYNISAITMGSHTGTHIDAPSHFVPGGKTIDQIPLSFLIGPALVINLTHKKRRERIVWADLLPFAERMKPGVILILYTGWYKHWGTEEYFSHPFLERGAAEEVLARGVRVLGTDTLNPDETPYGGCGGELGFGVHEVILGGDGIIVENLTNLAGLADGMRVHLLPLNLEGCDGSPVRAYASW